MNVIPSSKIIIRDLPVFGYHGVYADEHVRGTQFRVDVVITLDDRLQCFKDDAIAHALNYEGVVRDLLEIGTTQQFQLIERLAEVFAESVLSHAEATSVEVTVHKLVSGLSEEPQWIAVSITRGRPH